MNIGTLIREFGSLISGTFSLMIGIGLLVFLWGLVKFILNKGSESKVDEGKNLMIWGLIALFVMVSVRGLLLVLQDLFDLFDFDL